MRLAIGEPLPPSVPSPTQVCRLSSGVVSTIASVLHIVSKDRSAPMKRRLLTLGFLAGVCFAGQTAAWAGQAPGAASDPDIPISHRDRVYAAEQFSNTVSVTDPVDNKLLGVIRLGDPQPGNFSPLYKGQVLVHGMGFSPDHKTHRGGLDRLQFRHLHRHRDQCGEAHHLCRPLAARGVLHARWQGGLGHGSRRGLCRRARRTELRGEDAHQGRRPARACRFSRRTANTAMSARRSIRKRSSITVADHQIVGRVKQESPFCPNIAATPDGKQVWFTLKDIGKTHGVRCAAAVRGAEDRSTRGRSPITSTSPTTPTAPLPM